MLRVGFLLNFPVEYKGGINYIRNLFYAVDKFHKNEIQLILFVPGNLGEEYISLFQEYAIIVRVKILQERSISWFISKVGEKVFRFDVLTYFLLKKHKINIISHSNYVFPGKSIKSINWIPDFQYLHYPQLFPAKELAYVNKWHSRWIRLSDRIIVSSNDARRDLESRHSIFQHKVRVLHFVSQPDILKAEQFIDISKYVEPGEIYFYLPNQFWQHKNHLAVFKAVKILKERGVRCLVLTSGLIHDFRNKNLHVKMLQDFVVEHDLSNHIKFLGLIPYPDVLQLIKTSIAVINPSFFEGWSSTVEEAKSIGKKVVLSDISVHREQRPENGHFFNPDDHNQLAEVLLSIIEAGPLPTPLDDKEKLLLKLEKRTQEFANTYFNILQEIK